MFSELLAKYTDIWLHLYLQEEKLRPTQHNMWIFTWLGALIGQVPAD